MPNFKVTERILKAARKKQITYKAALIRLVADLFSTETLHARGEWQEIFQVTKSKGLQPRQLYPARLSFQMEGVKRSFPDKKRKKKCEKNTTQSNQHCKSSTEYFKKMKKKKESNMVQRGGKGKK